MAKMSNFRPKIGQDATFAPTLIGHNSAIFYPILTFDHTKMISSARKIPLKAQLYLNLLDFGFLVHFLLQGVTWAALGLWTQNHLQVIGTCPGHGP